MTKTIIDIAEVLPTGELARLTTELASQLGEKLQALSADITTAESCTGGLIAAALTEVPGSSAWFRQGVVTYSNEAKSSLLDVPADIFERDGAVSEACVRAMVVGALEKSGARAAVSVSGIAGPDGGSVDKPVGTVWIGWALGNRVKAECFVFPGTRRSVREQAVFYTLRGIIELLESSEYIKT